MSDTPIRGQVSFVNHEKKYILIEYEQNGKKKAVKGNIHELLQEELKAQKRIRKIHRYQIGDAVEFQIKLSRRGDQMVAENIQYRYNPGLDMLINKAKQENIFTGYLKIADGKYFVKETVTYIFFPLPPSPWQVPPTEQELNEPIRFSLENLENKEKITASLLSKKFIPEYYSAVKAFKNRIPVKAQIVKISSHAVFINLFGNKIQAKLPVNENRIEFLPYGTLKPGDSINVLITYFGDSRIIVEQFTENLNDNKD